MAIGQNADNLDSVATTSTLPAGQSERQAYVQRGKDDEDTTGYAFRVDIRGIGPDVCNVRCFIAVGAGTSAVRELRDAAWRVGYFLRAV